MTTASAQQTWQTRLSSAWRITRVSFQLQIANNLTRNTFQFTALIQPVLFAILAVSLYQYGSQIDLTLYGIIGAGMIGIWNGNLWTSGYIVSGERRDGTLELMVASPTSFELVLFGRSLANALVSIISMGMTFLTGALVYRLPLGIERPGLFFIGLLLTLLSMTTLGLLFGTFFVLSRAADRLPEVLNYPIFILSGLTFPISTLPLWTRPLSLGLAPTWGNDLLGQAVGLPASLSGSPATSYVYLLTLSALYYFLANRCYRVIERRVRQTGDIVAY